VNLNNNENSFLESKRIKLRALEPADVELLYKWENNTSLWHVSNTLTPFSKYILKKYIENSHLDIFEAKQLRLIIDVIENTPFSVGAIDLFDFDAYNKRAGLGILINDINYRKKGYASEALKLIIDYAFNYLKLHQLYCNISIDNATSINLFEGHGFVKTGEKIDWLNDGKKWKNEAIFQLINS